MSHQTILMIPVVVMTVALCVFIVIQPRRDRAFHLEADRLHERLLTLEQKRANLIEQQIGLRSHTEQFRDEQILKEWLS